ncbi:MAG TPA: hypothetical protein VF006_28690 [Longimicrobium sp.]
MSVKSYYRWALVLPLLLPALASPLALLNPLPPLLALVAMYLFWSVLIGGVPYLLFTIGFLLWTRGASEERVRRAILVSPLLYTAVLMACFTALLLVEGSWSGSGDSLVLFGAFGLLFGYGYVGVAEAGRVLLRPGTARREPAPAA